MLYSKHFESTCFNEKKLFRTAVPGVQCYKDTTISNLPDQPAIFEPIASSSRVYPLRDHNPNIIAPTNDSEMFVYESSKQEGDQKNKILSALIKEVLNSCFDAGLNICASVCDLDGVNNKALDLLGASVENPCIETTNKELESLNGATSGNSRMT
ncbi:unnamed protein product [Parnassius apollo]|uniref:(apollo) hypothetical protein n=1 Tax=Parnassius apollo TaxID=110799 RepID=A0A8S3XJU3_PARAO|nr:unnamed protein product [Parnassius apollo]